MACLESCGEAKGKSRRTWKCEEQTVIVITISFFPFLHFWLQQKANGKHNHQSYLEICGELKGRVEGGFKSK